MRFDLCAHLRFTVAPAPFNVTAVQVGPTSVTVSWTQSSGIATGYWIYYVSACGGDSGSVGPITGTSHTLDNLQNDQTYTITMNAVGHKHLPSSSVTTIIGTQKKSTYLINN